MNEKTSRNYGIDLLRVLAMLAIVLLHLLGHGGLLQHAEGVKTFSALWGLEILALPAVNTFVLLSGFVQYREGRAFPNFKNVVSLFFTVLFYSVTLCLCFSAAFPTEVTLTEAVRALFPISTGQYWYFSAYVIAVLFSPMLNLFVEKASRRQLNVFCILIGVLFSVLGAMWKYSFDPFRLGAGYGALWFLYLYVLGAAIKKQEFFLRLSKAKFFLLLALSYLVSCMTKIFLHFKDVHPALNGFEDTFVSYLSPSTLLASVCLLCLFSSINVKSVFVKPLAFFSTSAFSVYLIHDNAFFRKFVVKDALVPLFKRGTVQMFLFLLLFAVTLFVACILLDKVRLFLFRLLRVESLSQKIGAFLSKEED